MLKHKRIFAAVTMLFVLLCSSFALANAAEPPGFTILVSNPPDDLTLYVTFPKDDADRAVELRKESKGWEAYFRFYYHDYDVMRPDVESAVITVSTGGETCTLPLPEQTYNTYNNLLMLELGSMALSVGQSEFRVPLLVALRVILTLALEGAVFYAFGYREKKSWLIFLVTNLATQGVLNALITGPNVGVYWQFGLLLGEVVVFAVEMAVFGRCVREKKKWQGVLYAFVANLLSFVLGGWFIANLPV